MAHHHGLNTLQGLHAFCHYGHGKHSGNRFGRLFDLPPLYIDPDGLVELGAKQGPMDGRRTPNRTNTVSVGHVFFGQFIDHDITLDVTSSLTKPPRTRFPTPGPRGSISTASTVWVPIFIPISITAADSLPASSF